LTMYVLWFTASDDPLWYLDNVCSLIYSFSWPSLVSSNFSYIFKRQIVYVLLVIIAAWCIVNKSLTGVNGTYRYM
jgi:hypothetical protein